MASDPIPFPHENASAPRDVGLTDQEVGAMLQRGIATLQDAMDTAQMAGLVIEPSFALIENRLAPCGMRLDSFVCMVRSFRRLT